MTDALRSSAQARRALFAFVAALGACQPSSTPVQAPAMEPEAYNTPIVLLVAPDSAEIAALQAELGDDFYIVADDAMWYRASAYALLDSLRIPYAEVAKGEAIFLVDGARRQFSWHDSELAWFAVVYDGVSEPEIIADVDLGSIAGRLPRAP